MSVTALDTHQVVKTLKAAGFTDEQAEAVTQVVRDSQNLDLSSLASKTDLQLALAETKAEILKWTMSAIGLQTVAIIGTVVALLRLGR